MDRSCNVNDNEFTSDCQLNEAEKIKLLKSSAREKERRRFDR